MHEQGTVVPESSASEARPLGVWRTRVPHLHVVGVRHHSPACARLVRRVIERVRPRHVLIEGPSDMNERIGELALGHTLPIAIYSFLRDEGELPAGSPGVGAMPTGPSGRPPRREATWAPFCSYSPEWVAIQTGREVGAEVRFADLPAWHEAFAEVRNRYHDRTAEAQRLEGERASRSFELRLVERYGVDDTDTLWDHLFEGAASAEADAALEDALATYFELLRGEQPGGPRDEPREAWMAAYAAWALGEARAASAVGDASRDVVVVCGGFHAPVLPALVEALLAADPAPPRPELDEAAEGVRRGSYLVPYSYKRLDAFAGYDAGMPSPGFYELVHERGVAEAGEALLERVVARLRQRKQTLSTADLIAARSLAEALARLRGHDALLRTDLLDGLAGALVKDGLDAPLPWARRGPLHPRTEPLLVEVVAALSGDREGRLAAETPLPPLVEDVRLELARVGCTPADAVRTEKLSLREERGREASRVLHRVAVLAVPGVRRLSGPAWATDAVLDEVWSLQRVADQLPALIEASIWGATLEQAALARIEHALLEADGHLRALTDVLASAVFVGIRGLASDVLARVEAALANEHRLADVGHACTRLLDLELHGDLFDARGLDEVRRLLAAIVERGLWLLEGMAGPDAPLDEGAARAVGALRDAVVRGPAGLTAFAERAEGVWSRRTLDQDAPPGVRGACLGALWSIVERASYPSDDARREATERQTELAIDATRAASLPTRLGDFLGGLFLVARTEALHAEGLLVAIDTVLGTLGDHEFLVALPSLRLAFSFFPPRERSLVAKRIAERLGLASASQLLAQVDVASVERGLRLDRAASALARRFGLVDALDEATSGEPT